MNHRVGPLMFWGQKLTKGIYHVFNFMLLILLQKIISGSIFQPSLIHGHSQLQLQSQKGPEKSLCPNPLILWIVKSGFQNTGDLPYARNMPIAELTPKPFFLIFTQGLVTRQTPVSRFSSLRIPPLQCNSLHVRASTWALLCHFWEPQEKGGQTQT